VTSPRERHPPCSRPGRYCVRGEAMKSGTVAAAALVCTLAASWSGAADPGARFARAERRDIVGHDGRPLHLKGIGLGNWLLPEGYMFLFHKGATSPRQIQELFAELVGPDDARAFWTKFRDAWVTRDDIGLLKQKGFD